MSFLTSTGLTKLKFLKNEIESISEKKYEDPLCTSDYSKEMVSEALSILNYIQENNDKSLGKDEIKKIVTHLKPSISIIDNKKLTGIPVIFNTESFLLAKAFCDFLNSLDLSNDINPIISIALQMKTSKSSKSEIFRQHLDEMNINIQLYDLLEKASSTHKTVNRIKAKIATRINYYKSAEILDIDTLKEKYKTFIDSILLEIKLIPSFILNNESVYQYYNQHEPYNIDTNKLDIIGVISSLYKQLINLENVFNERFIPENPVSFVIDTTREIFTKEQVEDYKADIVKKIKSLDEDLNIYLTGKHLKFFQTIHKDKIKLVNNVLTQTKIAKERKNLDSSACNPFDFYKILVRASIKNLEFSKHEKISPGKTGNILSRHQSILLKLAIDRPAGCDEENYKLFCNPREKRPLGIKFSKS
jgi:hypothetical protein